MNVLLFQGRFEEAVVSGRKPHSIRPDRRDGRPRARVGEALSLRVWTGKPYRSQQREIARAVVTEVERLAIRTDGVMWRPGSATEVLWAEQEELLAVLLHTLAHADGFVGWAEMRDWFATTHGLPFTGVLIRWSLTRSHLRPFAVSSPH